MPYIDWPIILAGDFNCVMDGSWDRDPPRKDTKPNMLAALGLLMKHFTFKNVWRDTNSDKRECTCLTPGYTTHSRLDRFLMSEDIAVVTDSIMHQDRYLSDHAPVVLQLNRGGTRPKAPLWRLRPDALKDR